MTAALINVTLYIDILILIMVGFSWKILNQVVMIDFETKYVIKARMTRNNCGNHLYIIYV